AKKIKYTSVFDQIGRNLSEGIPPTIKQLLYASNNANGNSTLKSEAKSKEIDPNKIRINELLLRKMWEWNSIAKVLSSNESAYIADFAWGLKKLNSFHEGNMRLHLKTLIKNGFDIN